MPIFLLNGWNWLLNNKWAQYLGAALLLFAGYHAWKRNVEAGVRRLDRERQARVNAEEAARIETKRREISEERTDAVTHAEQVARDHVVSSSPAELRARDPGLADLVYGHAGGRSSETEGR